jgi:hypothetical protein
MFIYCYLFHSFHKNEYFLNLLQLLSKFELYFAIVSLIIVYVVTRASWIKTTNRTDNYSSKDRRQIFIYLSVCVCIEKFQFESAVFLGESKYGLVLFGMKSYYCTYFFNQNKYQIEFSLSPSLFFHLASNIIL